MTAMERWHLMGAKRGSVVEFGVLTHNARLPFYLLEYCSSLTFSSHSTVLPFSAS
jgi:hypothetical protein